MKVIVTGSRAWDDENKLFLALNALLVLNGPRLEQFEVVHGGALGADRLASRWVSLWQDWHPKLPLPHLARLGPVVEKAYPVSDEAWRASRAAGLHRNTRMVAENRDADLVVAFSRAGSRGTAHCVAEALRWELPIWFIDYDLGIPQTPNPIPPWWPAKGL